MRLKRILVPVDFSDGSASAVQYALLFQKRFGASLHLVHVFEIPPLVPAQLVVMTGDVSSPFGVHMEDVADQQMDSFVAQLKLAEGVEVSRQILVGPPASAIVDAIEKNNADMIIMGTHGRTGIARLLMGSTAEQVVRHATCPVLTVPLPKAEG